MFAPNKSGRPTVVIQVEPVEIGGKFWVEVIIGGSKMEKRGPFSTIDEAEAVVGRLSRVARSLSSGGGNRG
jgi:hypothetical protein